MKTSSITRREFLAAAGVGAVGLTAVGRLALGQAAAIAPTGKPLNILLILADDLGYHDLGCYGSTLVETPAIDRLAKEGLRFTNAYAACPVCSPTRASILTGKYPARLHLTDFIPGKEAADEKLLIPDWTKRLVPEEVTLAEVLKAAGYRTGIIGKWHLEGKPADHGFDEDPVPNHAPKRGEPDLTRQQAQTAAAFIERHKEQPFFCYLSFNAVHAPMVPREELLKKYEAKVRPGTKPGAAYLAVTEEMDRAIDLVLKKIDDLGLRDRTLVVFMSDNGGFMGTTTNAPLRGFKGQLYEGGIRVPLIVRWPGVVKPGTTSDAVVTSADQYPTLLEIAHAPGDAKHNAGVDGRSLVPLLKGGAAPQRSAVYWHYPHYHAGKPSGAVRSGDWKLIEFYEDSRVELYNLKDDPVETKDLAQTNAPKAKELQGLLANWRTSVGAQMPTANSSYKAK